MIFHFHSPPLFKGPPPRESEYEDGKPVGRVKAWLPWNGDFRGPPKMYAEFKVDYHVLDLPAQPQTTSHH